MRLNVKIAETAALLGMAISVFCAGFCGFEEDYRHITDTVFRLHIIANSDSEEDQALKLAVRDAVLEQTSCLFRDCGSAEEAAAAAEENLELFQTVSEGVVSEYGSDCPVRCEVTKMEFDDRVYGDITMPAGEYSALRITIGEAAGKNWWCVMFPPLCLPAAETDEAMEAFSPEELEILEDPEQYECRFYILELLEKVGKTNSTQSASQ